MLEKNLIDTQENFWAIPNEKVIWEGQPFIRWDIIKIAMTLCLILISLPILLLNIDTATIILILANLLVMVVSILYFIYDYFKTKTKYKYVLLSNFLMIRAGNKLASKYFKLADIEGFELRNQKIVIHLKDKIWNPYLTFMIREIKTLKIGPFENADSIYGILNQHLLDYKNENQQ